MLFIYNVLMWLRFERLKAAVEKSKQRNVAIGGKQAVWFEPSGVDPVAKKVPKTYDDLVKEREGLVLRKPVVEPASASAAEESKHEAVEVRSYDPMAEQLAELKHIAAEQSIVLRDVARFLYPQVRGSAPAKRVCVQLMLYPTRLCSSPSGHPQYHKDFANAKVGALPPCSRDRIQPCAPLSLLPVRRSSAPSAYGASCGETCEAGRLVWDSAPLSASAAPAPPLPSQGRPHGWRGAHRPFCRARLPAHLHHCDGCHPPGPHPGEAWLKLL